tara:strand:+ start:1071 stop:1331 length:261 start_codon:yes stop_codon:yes gene_type:complete
MGKVWKRFWLRNHSAAAKRRNAAAAAPVATASGGGDNSSAEAPVVEAVTETPQAEDSTEEVAKVVVAPKVRKATPKKRTAKTRKQT